MLRMALAGPGPATMSYRAQSLQRCVLAAPLLRAHASSRAKAMAFVKKKPLRPRYGLKPSALPQDEQERAARSSADTTGSSTAKSPKGVKLKDGQLAEETVNSRKAKQEMSNSKPAMSLKGGKLKDGPTEFNSSQTKAAKVVIKKISTPASRKAKELAVKRKGSATAKADQLHDPEPSTPSDDEILTLLPPPLATVNAAGHAQKTIDRLRAGDVKGAMKAWGTLVDSQAGGAVPLEQLEELSTELVNILNGPKRLLLRSFSLKNPEAFGILRHMAIETGAHDKWEGLNEFMLELLGEGQPSLAASTWQDFMRRAREVQGRDAQLLKSPKREERVAGRLEGEGMLPLMLAQIAALTMLNQFDQNAVLTFLCTNAGVRGDVIRETDWKPIRRRLEGHGRLRSREVFKRFAENVDALTLCVMCYHPRALIVRIETLGALDDGGKALRQLYDRMLKASIGPGRLIVPVIADALHYDVVPFPPSVWKQFMLSFAVLGSSESILRMIEVDLPARYSRTPTQMLGFAMMELAHMSARTAKARTDVRPIVDALWDQIIERGQQDAPSMLRYRLEALNYVHDAKASFGLYDYAKVELRKRKIAYGDAYINPLHFSHLCFTNRLSAALAVLDDHQNCDHIANRIAYVEFIKHALGNDMDVASRRKLLWKIMQIKPDDVRIRGGSWGRILAFFLECGQPIERACEEVAKKRGIGQSTSFFAPLIRNLIRAKSDSSEQQLEAAVYLLERHFPRDASATTTAFRTFATWRPVATFVSRSNVLSGPHRHELLERLVACYPRNFPHENIDLLYLAIVHASLSRPTEEGVPEALYWWSKISPGNASAHHYKMLISRLVYHGYPQVAEEIVATLRPGPKTQQVITYAQSLGITTGLAHGDIDLHLEQPESLEDREELLEDEGEAEEVLSDEADTVLTQS